MASEYRKSHYRFILMFMLCLCAMSIMLTIGAVKNTRQVHAVETYNEIYEIKKVFLKNTVQNMVRTIETCISSIRERESSTGIDSSPISTGSIPTIRYDSQHAHGNFWLIPTTATACSSGSPIPATTRNSMRWAPRTPIRHKPEPGTALP